MANTNGFPSVSGARVGWLTLRHATDKDMFKMPTPTECIVIVFVAEIRKPFGISLVAQITSAAVAVA